MIARENSATMKVVWDALGQVIREVLYWVLVLVIGERRHML
jgi:YD repeat-containing protein